MEKQTGLQQIFSEIRAIYDEYTTTVERLKTESEAHQQKQSELRDDKVSMIFAGDGAGYYEVEMALQRETIMGNFADAASHAYKNHITVDKVKIADLAARLYGETARAYREKAKEMVQLLEAVVRKSEEADAIKKRHYEYSRMLAYVSGDTSDIPQYTNSTVNIGGIVRARINNINLVNHL